MLTSSDVKISAARDGSRLMDDSKGRLVTFITSE